MAAQRPPHDIVGVSGGVSGWVLEPNSDGSINVRLAGSPSAVTRYANWTTSSSGDTTVHAGSASLKHKVIGYGLNANGTTNVKFTDGASGSTLGMLLYLIANTGSNDRGGLDSVLFEGGAGNDLVVNNSNAIAMSGHCSFLLEA